MMRGIAFGLLRETLSNELGGEEWRAMLGQDTGVPAVSGDGPSELPGDRPSDALICWLGQKAVAQMATRYPSLFSSRPDFGTFLKSLEDSLSAGWLKSDREEVAPALEVTDTVGGDFYLTLRRAGRACALLKGFVSGAAVLYGRAVFLQEVKCSCHGDNACVILVQDLGSVPATEADRSMGRAVAGKGRLS